MGISPFDIPEIVLVAVRKDNEAAILRNGVASCLFLSGKGVNLLRLCLKNDEWKTFAIEEEEVYEAVFGFFKVVAIVVENRLGNFNFVFEEDICSALGGIEKTPSRLFEELIDFYACLCFLIVHVQRPRGVAWLCGYSK